MAGGSSAADVEGSVAGLGGSAADVEGSEGSVAGGSSAADAWVALAPSGKGRDSNKLPTPPTPLEAPQPGRAEGAAAWKSPAGAGNSSTIGIDVSLGR